MHVQGDVGVYTVLTLPGSWKVGDVLPNYIFIPHLLQHFETTVLLVLLRCVCALPAAPENIKTSLFASIFFSKIFLIDRLAIFFGLP